MLRLRGCAVSSDKATLLLSQGQALLAKGDSKKALGIFAKAVVADPSHAFAFFHYAEALERAGDDVQALSMYREAIRLRPAIAQEQIDMGVDMLLEGTFGRAVYEFKHGTTESEEEKNAAARAQPMSVDDLMANTAQPPPPPQAESPPDDGFAMPMDEPPPPAPESGGFFEDPMATMPSEAPAQAFSGGGFNDPMAGMFEDPMADMSPPPPAPAPQPAAGMADPLAGLFEEPAASHPPSMAQDTPTVVMDLSAMTIPPAPSPTNGSTQAAPPAQAAAEQELVFEEMGENLFEENDFFAAPQTTSSAEGAAGVAALFEGVEETPLLPEENAPTVVFDLPRSPAPAPMAAAPTVFEETPPPAPMAEETFSPTVAFAPPPQPPPGPPPVHEPPLAEMADLFGPPSGFPDEAVEADATATVAFDLPPAGMAMTAAPAAPAPDPMADLMFPPMEPASAAPVFEAPAPAPPVETPAPDFSFGGALEEDEPGTPTFAAAVPPPVVAPEEDFSFGGALPEDDFPQAGTPVATSVGASAPPGPAMELTPPLEEDFSFGGVLEEDEPGTPAFASAAPPPVVAPEEDFGFGGALPEDDFPQAGTPVATSAGLPVPSSTETSTAPAPKAEAAPRHGGFDMDDLGPDTGFSFGAAVEEEQPQAASSAAATPGGDDLFADDQYSFGASVSEPTAEEDLPGPAGLSGGPHDDAGLDVDINIVQVVDPDRATEVSKQRADEVMGRDMGIEENFWDAPAQEDEGFGFGASAAETGTAEETPAAAPGEEDDFADMFTTGAVLKRGEAAAPLPAEEEAPGLQSLSPTRDTEDEFTFGGGDDHGLGESYDFSGEKPAVSAPQAEEDFSFGGGDEEEIPAPAPAAAAPVLDLGQTLPDTSGENDFLASLGVDFSGPEDIGVAPKTATQVFTTPTESWAAMLDDMAPPPTGSKASAPWKGKTSVFTPAEMAAPPPAAEEPALEIETPAESSASDFSMEDTGLGLAEAAGADSMDFSMLDTGLDLSAETPAASTGGEMDFLSDSGLDLPSETDFSSAGMELDAGLDLDLDALSTVGAPMAEIAPAPAIAMPSGAAPVGRSALNLGGHEENEEAPPAESEEGGYNQTLRWLNPTTDQLSPGSIVEVHVRVDDLYGVAVEGEALSGEIVDKDTEGLSFLTPQKREGVPLYFTETYADFSGAASFNVELGKSSGANRIKVSTMHAEPLIITFNTAGLSATKLVITPKGGLVPGGLTMTAKATAYDANNNPVADVPVTFVVVEHEGDLPTFISPMGGRSNEQGEVFIKFKMPDSPGSSLRLSAKTPQITALSVTPLMAEVKDSGGSEPGRYADETSSSRSSGGAKPNPLAVLAGVAGKLKALLPRKKIALQSREEMLRQQVQRKLNPTAGLQVKTVKRRVNTLAIQQKVGALLGVVILLGAVGLVGRMIYQKAIYPLVVQNGITRAMAKQDFAKLDELYGKKKALLARDKNTDQAKWDAMILVIGNNRVTWAKSLYGQNNAAEGSQRANQAILAYLDASYSSLGLKRSNLGGKSFAELTPQQLRVEADKQGAPADRRAAVGALFLGLSEAFKVRGRPGDCARAIALTQKAQWILPVEDQSLPREVARLSNLIGQGKLVCWQ